MTHLVSFISHGVFEKFPRLRLLLIEAGSAWLPSLLWRFDTEYKGLRREVPWLRKLPSEYVAEHVWLTTQPLEISPRREQVAELLGWINGAERLCYSSDYPHWDADESDYIAARLPTSWHRRVFFENALEFYGWQAADLTAAHQAALA
jgi:predicted TIM-barrel fold metal-dependent hydrolase